MVEKLIERCRSVPWGTLRHCFVGYAFIASSRCTRWCPRWSLSPSGWWWRTGWFFAKVLFSCFLCMMYNVLCIIFDVWCRDVAYHVGWFMIYDFWFLIYELWVMMFDVFPWCLHFHPLITPMTRIFISDADFKFTIFPPCLCVSVFFNLHHPQENHKS